MLALLGINIKLQIILQIQSKVFTWTPIPFEKTVLANSIKMIQTKFIFLLKLLSIKL